MRFLKCAFQNSTTMSAAMIVQSSMYRSYIIIKSCCTVARMFPRVDYVEKITNVARFGFYFHLWSDSKHNDKPDLEL